MADSSCIKEVGSDLDCTGDEEKERQLPIQAATLTNEMIIIGHTLSSPGPAEGHTALPQEVRIKFVWPDGRDTHL